MNILIKGIDLPKDVHGRLVLDDIRLIFSNANTRFSIPLDKDDIVQIDRPHGRLIDAGKIMKDLEEWKLNPNNDDEAVVFVNHFQGIIRTELTILEAEE